MPAQCSDLKYSVPVLAAAPAQEVETAAMRVPNAKRLAPSTEPLTVELLSAEGAAVHIAHWRRLTQTCLEPNIFLDPDFALSAARHIAKRAPRFLFVWEDRADAPRRLVGLSPLADQGAFGRLWPTRVWTHEQAPLGTPLIDRDGAADILAAILVHCRPHLSPGAGLLFGLLAQDGPFARLLTSTAEAMKLPTRVYVARPRACLSAGTREAISANRRRKLKKARAALEARGRLRLTISRVAGEIEAATQAFLTLEAKGWKGRRGTAFLKSPARTALVRDVAEKLAAAGKYFVVSLALDEHPLAMALILETGGRAFWWKIAYDEDFAAFSPGVLLAQEVTQVLLRDPRIAFTDSCTSGEQPMIEHIWSERMPIVDFLIGVRPDTGAAHAALVRRESLRRSLRTRLKAIVLRLRR
jgi:CelD/BcsL family acetyltransferase involved in cellulose biosynthesis